MGKEEEIAGGFLGYPISRLGYPVVLLRLHFGLIIVLPFFTFLAVMAHINFGWFNFTRQLYLISGLFIGIAGGISEAFLVIRKLKEEVEVVAWFLIPLSFIFWLLPTVFIYLYFGSKEFLPFCAYFLLPSFAVALVTNGFVFYKFEKREKVRVFTFFLSRYVPYPKYWMEFPETLEIKFYGFLDAVAEKDFSWMLHYGRYADQLKIFVEEFSKRSDEFGKEILGVKELLKRFLDEIRSFNQDQRRVSLIFVGSCFVWIAFLFYVAANNWFGVLQKYGSYAIFIFYLPLFLIFAYPAMKRKTLKKNYYKTIKAIFGEIDPKVQSKIKNILKSITKEKYS